ncbi:hypothetical protein [Nonomuraea sp. NPDC050786]|uniref:hypothetical protein n=1 Tax=Nonomuraea sp. NPDC050786 TaxID=3154840 RepID=UPI0033F035C8
MVPAGVRAGLTGICLHDIAWTSPVSVHRRPADAYRAERRPLAAANLRGMRDRQRGHWSSSAGHARLFELHPQ